MLEAGGGEAPVRPRLGVEAKIEAQGEGQGVGVNPARRAEADQEPVEVSRRQAGVVQRPRQRVGRQVDA
jgi:hypothetical protein